LYAKIHQNIKKKAMYVPTTHSKNIWKQFWVSKYDNILETKTQTLKNTKLSAFRVTFITFTRHHLLKQEIKILAISSLRATKGIHPNRDILHHSTNI